MPINVDSAALPAQHSACQASLTMKLLRAMIG